MKLRLLLIIPMVAILFMGCRRTEELVTGGTLDDYQPFRVGSSVTYKLDSTVYSSNQTSKIIRTYVVRFQTNGIVSDGEGRTAYRIIRSTRDAFDTSRWTPDQTFLAIPGQERLEWIEQNQRFILMNAPIRENFSWRGNRFINTVSNPQQQYLDGWDYTWKSVGLPFSTGNTTFQQTVTVDQRNDSINDGRDKSRYFSRDIARDVYAKGIGLVFRERFHEIWQPPNATSPSGYYEPGSFGIRMTYLSHKASP